VASEVDVFLRLNGGLQEVVELLQQEAGIALVVSGQQPRLFEASCLSISIAVFDEHGLENNLGIPFEEYPVEVSYKRFAGTVGSDVGEALCRNMALATGQLVAAFLGADYIVVEDLQRQIASGSHGEGSASDQ
jgi:hypothetical protein